MYPKKCQEESFVKTKKFTLEGTSFEKVKKLSLAVIISGFNSKQLSQSSEKKKAKLFTFLFRPICSGLLASAVGDGITFPPFSKLVVLGIRLVCDARRLNPSSNIVSSPPFGLYISSPRVVLNLPVPNFLVLYFPVPYPFVEPLIILSVKKQTAKKLKLTAYEHGYFLKETFINQH